MSTKIEKLKILKKKKDYTSPRNHFPLFTRRRYQVYSLVHSLICIKSLRENNDKNAAEFVINNHFYLYKAFEKVPRNLLTFNIMSQISNVKHPAEVMLRLQI